MSIHIVYLRRPKSPADMRSDPFWEFGSFGRTGCHGRNLLNLKTSTLSDGARLAFVQGGISDARVVALTPPIVVVRHRTQMEATWDNSYRPVPFELAPILVSDTCYPDFPAVLRLLNDVDRSTWCGAAASAFRSRSSAIDEELAKQISDWFSTGDLPKIEHYGEAIEGPSGAWRTKTEASWSNLDRRSLEFEKSGRRAGRKKCAIKTQKSVCHAT